MIGKWGLWIEDYGWMDLFGEYILYDYKSQADEDNPAWYGWQVRQFTL